MSFWLNKITINEVLINSIGSLIAWVIWSVFIIIITFMLWWVIDVTGTYADTNIWNKTTAIFPLVLSIISFVWMSLSLFLTQYLLTLTAPEKYKSNKIISGQIIFFSILTYIFITPVYLFAGLQDYDYIMYVYIFHIIITTFWVSLIIENLNNYRYLLIGFYGSFIGLFIASILALLIFNAFDSWVAKLIVLVTLLPIINFSITFCKQLFELWYYHYVEFTNQDWLGDIFYQIEMEEKEKLKEEEEKASI